MGTKQIYICHGDVNTMMLATIDRFLGMMVPDMDTDDADVQLTPFDGLLKQFKKKYGVRLKKYSEDTDEMRTLLHWMDLFAKYNTDCGSITMNEFRAEGGDMKLYTNPSSDTPLMDLESNDGTGFKFKIFEKPKNTRKNALPFFESVFRKLVKSFDNDHCYDARNQRYNEEIREQNAQWIDKLYSMWTDKMVLLWVENSFLAYDGQTNLTLNIKDSFITELRRDIDAIERLC